MSPPPEPGSAPGLPILISVPTTRPWLVAHYRIQCGYVVNKDPNQVKNVDPAVFDYRGGTLTGTIQPNTTIPGFPDVLSVNITVEYTPESELPALTISKTVPITNAGAIFALPLDNRRLQEFNLFFDLPHGVVQGDQLFVDWKYTVGGTVKHARFIQLKDNELLSQSGNKTAGPFVIGFIPDPAAAGTEVFHVEIDGTYYGQSLPVLAKDYPMDKPRLRFFIKDDPSGGGYHLEGP